MVLRLIFDCVLMFIVYPGIPLDTTDYIGKLEIITEAIGMFSSLTNTAVVFLLYRVLFQLKRVEL